MSVTAAELVRFSSANEPTDDVSTVGGAIALASRPELTQFTAPARLSLTSDGADVRTATIVGRDAAGNILQEVKALTGAAETLSVNTYERLESVTLSATDAARIVTLKQGAGGAVVATIAPNETTRHIRFRNSSSAVTQQDRYEKDHIRNGDATNALLSPSVQLTSDPAGKIKIGIAAAYGDTLTSANRKTAPAGITFVDDNIAPTMPTGGVAAGSSVGVWINQTLAPNDVAQKSSYTLTISGQTT